MMNIPPVPPASLVAGTAHAAAKGGETDKQSSEAVSQQQNANNPGGKAVDAISVEKGEKSGDRDGNGREMLDVFERTSDDESHETNEEKQDDAPESSSLPPEDPPHLDLSV